MNNTLQIHYNNVTWTLWRLQTTVTPAFVQAHIKENLKRRVTGLCEGNPPMTGGFLTQTASNAESVSISRHHFLQLIY